MTDKFRVEMANREEKPIEVDKEPVITIETASPDRLAWIEKRINEIDRLTARNFEHDREVSAGVQRRIAKLEIESAQADVTDRSFTRVHERIGAIEKESADNAKGVSDALRRLVQIEEQVAKDGANIEKLCKAFDLLLTEHRGQVDDVDRCQVGILNRIRALENWTHHNSAHIVLARVAELEDTVAKIRSPWQGIAAEVQQNRDKLLRVEREIRERIAALEDAVKKLEREVMGTGERIKPEAKTHPKLVAHIEEMYARDSTNEVVAILMGLANDVQTLNRRTCKVFNKVFEVARLVDGNSKKLDRLIESKEVDDDEGTSNQQR